MKKSKVYLIVLLFIILLFAGYVYLNNRNTQSDNLSCDDDRTIAFEEPTTEILTSEIDINGGVLQAKDDDGQWVVINIPPGAVKQKTKINLNVEKNTYEFGSGIKSSIVFTISPAMSFEEPVLATIVYDKKYSCDQILAIVPYLIKDDNLYRPAQLVGLYKNQNIFTMTTTSSGTYTWVYLIKD